MRHEPFAEAFYNSTAWKKCRAAYRKSVGGLCERCLKQGLFVPGDHVHHIQPITPETMTDPSISLNPDNLMLLCERCHHEVHDDIRHETRRWLIDESGNLLI